jgi:hypothetical protein
MPLCRLGGRGQVSSSLQPLGTVWWAGAKLRNGRPVPGKGRQAGQARARPGRHVGRAGKGKGDRPTGPAGPAGRAGRASGGGLVGHKGGPAGRLVVRVRKFVCVSVCVCEYARDAYVRIFVCVCCVY